MFAVIFETTPNPAEIQQYLAIAGALRPELLKIDGFLENERFRRNDDQGTLLSLSLWRDEKSLVRWRTQELHHQSQARGRAGVLSDYRLRIGEVTTQIDASGHIAGQATRDDITQEGQAPFASISIEMASADIARLDNWREHITAMVQFSAINQPERQLLLISWRTAQAGQKWLQTCSGTAMARHFGVNIIRSYGMHDRYEAPTYHLPVANGPV